MISNLVELMNNLAILVALSLVSGFIRQRRDLKVWGNILQGVLFGGAAILGMLRPVAWGPGLIMDGRSVMISLCGLFFGPIAGTLAGGITLLYRVFLGGQGVALTLWGIPTQVIMGIGFYYWWTHKGKPLTALRLYGFSVAIHLVFISIMVAVLGFETSRRFLIPVLVAYPLVALLIGKILSTQEVGFRAVESLRNNEKRLDDILNSVDALIYIKDVQGRYTYVNRKVCELFGHTAHNIIGKRDDAFFSGGSLAEIVQSDRPVIEQGETIAREEIDLSDADGRLHTFWSVKIPLKDASGAVCGLCGTSTDITDRKVTEAALRDSEERYRRITEGLTDYQYRVRVEHGQAMETTHGPGCETITGYSAQDFADNSYLWFTMIAPEDRDQARVLAAQRLNGQDSDPFEHRIYRKDGALRWVSDTCILHRDGEGNLLAYDGVVEDITERKASEEALRQSEERFHGLLQSVDFAAVKSYAPDGTTLFWNKASERLFGYSAEEAVGRSLLDLIIPKEMQADVKQAMQKMWETGQPTPASELSLVRKDGSRIAVYSSHAIVRVPGREPEMFCMDIDLTDRKRLEAQLHQSQKMESLGILAGGVAHDMNNVLAAVLGLASLHLDIQPPESSARRAFATITKACDRGVSLIQSLLGFARKGLAEEKALDMNTLIQDEVRLLERTTLARVRLEMDLAADLRPIQGDASALTHVLMNLCVNAVDAMAVNGTLTLRTRNLDDDWIEVQVEDNGCGMSKDVLEKALNPFFTTKEPGKGTGLGLSIAHSTIAAHHGRMEIQSELGRGTTISLRFPACDPATFEAEVAPLHRGEISQASLRVLLVDDDELIQGSMQAILETLGHTVEIAPSGEAALAKLEEGLEPDVVILDMNMPGLGGAGTLPCLRRARPALPVLLATGRADQTALDLVAAHAMVTLMPKPFGIRELQRNLESLQPR